jgi:predicted nucleic acid-binding protein
MKHEAFIDTGGFVAWLVRSDQQHDAASALFVRPPGPVATSLAVVAEAYGYFLHKHGEEAARLFRAALAALPRLTILESSLTHHAAVERRLDKHRGLKLTYVDASSLVHLSANRIRTVWGTDAHLGIEGARVVPGPP